MAEHDDGWNLVTRKRRRYNDRENKQQSRLDRAGVLGLRNMDEEVSYYFTPFLDDHGVKEMFRVFSMYGKATEVVIPAKRDKFERRFGFVRFKDVRDLELFATKLDNIIIGATMMYVNVPRFSRDNNQLKVPRKVNGRNDVEDAKVREARAINEEDRKGKRVLRDEQSPNENPLGADQKKNYKMTKGGYETKENRHYYNKRKGGWWRHKGKEQSHMGLLCYDVSEEEINRFKKMFVGYVPHPGSTYMIQEWLSMHGIFSIKVTPLGENSVLMEEMEDGALQTLLNEDESMMKEWFDDIRQWQSFVRDDERVT